MAVSAPATTPDGGNGTYQYIRNFGLLVTDSNQNTLDLSALRCKFSIKRSSNETPNTADIRVYNLASETANQIQQNFSQNYTLVPGTATLKLSGKSGTVIIQGGYDSNHGVVFAGNIKQVIVGRESATDTFLDLICGDGDFAYNFAIVKNTVAKGASQSQIFSQLTTPMMGLGLTLGTSQPALLPGLLPRGKTMYGMSKDYLGVLARQNEVTWSIQNETITTAPMNGYTPGETVILTSKTGMVGAPQQTSIGINVVCLMNPNINPGRAIKIDQASVQGLKIDLSNKVDPANLPTPLNLDGVYFVLVVEQQGDTRGLEWYSKLICLSIKPTTNPLNSISVNYGP